MLYDPQPIDTRHVEIPREIRDLIERLAENTHDVWARQRMSEGWSYGPRRDDGLKQNPCLVGDFLTREGGTWTGWCHGCASRARQKSLSELTFRPTRLTQPWHEPVHAAGLREPYPEKVPNSMTERERLADAASLQTRVGDASHFSCQDSPCGRKRKTGPRSGRRKNFRQLRKILIAIACRLWLL